MIYAIFYLHLAPFGDRNNIISPSEMSNDIYQKEKNYDLLQTTDMKGMADTCTCIHTQHINFIYAFFTFFTSAVLPLIA